MSNLRKIREEKGLRVVDVATISGVGQTSIWKMESGREVSRRKKIIVAKALGIPFDELFPKET